MRRRRITVVTPYFAPEHSGTAPYSTAIAHHLAKTHQVTVLTGVPHYPQWEAAGGYDERITVEDHDGVRVLRGRHFVPSEQTATTRGRYELSLAARALESSRGVDADLVLAFTPPVLTGTAARLIAKKQRAKLGVVVHDLAGKCAVESGIAGGGGRVGALVNRVEGSLLRSADGVVVLHESFSRDLVGRLGVDGQKVQVIRNWVHTEAPTRDRATVRRMMGWNERETVVLHTGNMGMKQGLENVVEAARLADSDQAPVRFVMMGDGNQREKIFYLAEHVWRCDLRMPAGRDLYSDILNAADVLLVNERAGLTEMSVPSKLTSYMAVGQPVLAVTGTGTPTDQEMHASGAGPVLAPGNPRALLDAALALRDAPGAAAAYGAAGRRFADTHFSETNALARYDAWVEDLLGRAPARPTSLPRQRAAEPATVGRPAAASGTPTVPRQLAGAETLVAASRSANHA